VPFEQREKTLLFITTTGHFYGGKGSRAFAHEHAEDLLKNAILDINLEHLGARNYVDDGKGNGVFDGEQALSIVFVNEDYKAIATASRMMQETQPERTLLIPSTLLGPVPPGEAGHYHMYTGVDFIHWIGQPYYLLTADDTLDKVDVSQLYPLAKGVSSMIGTYMKLEQ
jgi:Zn-dependent M28 family amino/carboxypeptidase